MLLESHWLDFQKVAYLKFSEDVDKSTVTQARDNIRGYLEQARGNKIHIIVETLPLTSLKLDVRNLYSLLVFMHNAAIEYVVTVGEMPLYQQWTGQTLARILGFRHQHLETLEDAISFLEALETVQESVV